MVIVKCSITEFTHHPLIQQSQFPIGLMQLTVIVMLLQVLNVCPHVAAGFHPLFLAEKLTIFLEASSLKITTLKSWFPPIHRAGIAPSWRSFPLLFVISNRPVAWFEQRNQVMKGNSRMEVMQGSNLICNKIRMEPHNDRTTIKQ